MPHKLRGCMQKPYSKLLDTVVASNKKLLILLKYPAFAQFLMKHLLAPKLIDDNPAWATTLRTAVLKLGAGEVNYRALKAIRYALVAAQEGYIDTLEAFRNGEKIAWIDWMMPSDIVRAAGFKTYVPTGAVTGASSQGPSGGASYAARCEDEGISEVLCSINKTTLGTILAGEIPKPTLCVGGTHPCDPGRVQNTLINYLNQDTPTFIMDTPYGRSDYELERWLKSAWELVAWLEKLSGKELDWKYLEESARNMHRFNQAVNEITELHRNRPAPPLMGMLNLLWRIRISEPGHPLVAVAAEKMRDTARWYVEHYTKKKAKREKIRVIIGDPSVIWMDYASWMYKKFGARVVNDYIGASYFPEIDTTSRDGILRTLINEKLYIGMIRQSHGISELNLDEFEQILEDYDADCVIFNNHAGCKHGAALKKMLIDACRKAGIPALFIDMDIIDSRFLSEKEIKERIENFFLTYGLI